MKPEDFFALVGDMRKAQRDWFRSKRPTALDRAKELERQVDQVLKDGRYAQDGELFGDHDSED